MVVLANWAETPFFLKLALDLSQAKKSSNNEVTDNHEKVMEYEGKNETETVSELDRFDYLELKYEYQ